MEVIDLTQPLQPDTVLWPGSPPFRAEELARVAEDGYYARVLATPEHAGTHLDAPAHFVADGHRVGDIPAASLVVGCAVVDVAAECEANPSFGVGAERLLADEERHGRLPRGGAVLVRTGWDAHVRDRARYMGGETADALSFPGLTADGARLLVERGVVGIGIDTLSVDRGEATDYPVHHVTLPAGLWHLEGLVNLGAVPVRGALLFAGALRLPGGSGAPARVLAVVGAPV